MTPVRLGDLPMRSRFTWFEHCDCSGYLVDVTQAGTMVTIDQPCCGHRRTTPEGDINYLVSPNTTVLVCDFMDAMERIEA